MCCFNYGKYHGRLFSTESKFGFLRQRQLGMSNDQVKKLAIAKEIATGKLLNQRTLLMCYCRQNNLPQFDALIDELRQYTERIEKVSGVASLQGIEGHASALYYRALKDMLKQDLGFVARMRRPPTDPINSLLSFGYTLIMSRRQCTR